jgi:hypothetical protein
MLGEDVQAMALRNAYAIDMLAPDTLTRRRECIAGIHGLSIDTIGCTSARLLTTGSQATCPPMGPGEHRKPSPTREPGLTHFRPGLRTLNRFRS